MHVICALRVLCTEHDPTFWVVLYRLRLFFTWARWTDGHVPQTTKNRSDWIQNPMVIYARFIAQCKITHTHISPSASHKSHASHRHPSSPERFHIHQMCEQQIFSMLCIKMKNTLASFCEFNISWSFWISKGILIKMDFHFNERIRRFHWMWWTNLFHSWKMNGNALQEIENINVFQLLYYNCRFS